MIAGTIESIGGATSGISAAGGGGHAVSFGAVLSGLQPPPAPPTAVSDYLGATIQPLTQALDGVNGEARQLQQIAQTVASSGGDLSPGDAIMLSMQCSEFMFHCELTASAANQSSDGIQELFKQQS